MHVVETLNGTTDIIHADS